MTTPSNKIPLSARDFADVTDWENNFALSLAALYVGFGLDENQLERVVPPVFLSRAKAALPEIVKQYEGRVRGFCLTAPEGAVPAANAWIDEQYERYLTATLESEEQPAEAEPARAAVDPAALLVVHDGNVPPWLAAALRKTRLFSLDELRADYVSGKLQPRPYVIQGRIRRGQLTVIVSPPGEGKSMAGDQLAVCLSLGILYMGLPTRSMSTVYADLEMGNPDHYPRFQAIASHLKADHAGKPIYLLDGTEIRKEFTPDHLDMLLVAFCQDQMVDVHDCLFIVDSLAEFEDGADENAVNDMVPVLGALRDFARKHDVPVVAFHHTNKSGDPRGSSAILGAVDNMWLISPASKADREWRLECLKARRSKKFQDERIVREYIPASVLPRSQNHDPLDDEPFAGFIWVSKGPWSRAESGDKDHQGMSAAEVEHCRAVVRCFRSPDEKVPATELQDRYCKLAKAKNRTAKAAVKDADKHHYTSPQKGGEDARGVLRTLTPKGRDAWQRLDGKTAEVE